jgi:hypothetical protein
MRRSLPGFHATFAPRRPRERPGPWVDPGKHAAARWTACQGCDSKRCEVSDLLACVDWILVPADNVGYLSGGATAPGGGDLTTLYRYHLDSKTVDVLASMTSPRGFHAAWLYEGKLCVAGGLNAADVSLASTQCFDFGAGGWNPENSDLPELPGTLWSMGCDLLCGVPVVAWGADDTDIRGSSWSYDPPTHAWQPVRRQRI